MSNTLVSCLTETTPLIKPLYGVGTIARLQLRKGIQVPLLLHIPLSLALAPIHLSNLVLYHVKI